MKKIIFSTIIIAVLFSCKKDNLGNMNATATLSFSSDTISFDTIFSSIGSITKTLTVYNYNNFDIRTNINLSGISSAHFRINIDGKPGNNQNNIDIPSNDSLFIFIEVTIDPSNINTPYILSDSLIFNTGESKQRISLIAWGQDAYFHTADTFGLIINGIDTTRFYYHLLDCSEPWTNDKPHVVYGYAIINPGDILTINEGCNIYLHNNSGILVGNPFSNSLGGSIKINGTLGNEVTLQGDRLDSWYKDMPGQWDRIWLMPGSINNEINYAIIKNGNIGIHADTVFNNNPTLEISNTIIKNMSGIGILGQGANIVANNTVISRCGQYAVACNIGGKYNFSHCTFANYWSYSNRNTPSILLNNYYESSDGEIYIRDLEEANFINCIIDGSLSTEISFQQENSGIFNYKFDHCLLKIDPTIDTNNDYYHNTIINQAPKFSDKLVDDFNITSSSPVINTGNIIFDGTTDINGNIRTNADIGAYEFID